MATYYDQRNSRTTAAKIRAQRVDAANKKSKPKTTSRAPKPSKKSVSGSSEATIRNMLNAAVDRGIATGTTPAEAPFDLSGGGGGGGSRGGGGGGGGYAAALAAAQGGINSQFDQQLGTLRQTFQGGYNQINDADAQLKLALSGLATQGQADTQKAAASIDSTRTALAQQSQQQLAALQADLQTQGVGVGNLNSGAAIQSRDLADAAARQSELSTRIGQIGASDITNRQATAAAMGAGATNTLTAAQTQQELALQQARQEALASLASGGGGGGGGRGGGRGGGGGGSSGSGSYLPQDMYNLKTYGTAQKSIAGTAAYFNPDVESAVEKLLYGKYGSRSTTSGGYKVLSNLSKQLSGAQSQSDIDRISRAVASQKKLGVTRRKAYDLINAAQNTIRQGAQRRAATY